MPNKKAVEKPRKKADFLPWQKELKALMDKDSRLSPKKVLDYAQDPGTALHKCFEWDDSKAAEKYRMDQARHLIRRVRVLVIQPPDIRIHARVFHSLPGDRGKGPAGSYREIRSILASKQHTLEMLKMARQDAQTFIDKYNFLRNHSQSIGDVLDALDLFIKE